MKKWKSIQELIALLEAERREIDVRLEALRRSPGSFNDEVLLKYIETRSTVKSAEYFKAKSIRSAKGTVYSSGDVSALIQGGGEDVDETLLRISRDIFNRNSNAVARAYG